MHLSMWRGEAPTTPKVIARNDNAADRLPLLLTLRFDMQPFGTVIHWRPRIVDTARRFPVKKIIFSFFLK